MRISKEYEASDIDVKNNKMHASVMVSLALTVLAWPRGVELTDDQIMDEVTKSVAAFLNMMEKSGLDIVPKEQIPDAFRAI